jgi:hypothetical protein
MIEAYAVVAGTLVLAGAIIGFLVVIALGIHREETALTMSSPAGGRMVRGVRVVTGMTSIDRGIVREVRPLRQELLP